MNEPKRLYPVTVTRLVPAKINPFLAVTGVRDDGYHELTTVFQTVSVWDRVTVTVTAASGAAGSVDATDTVGKACKASAVTTENEPVPQTRLSLEVPAGLDLGPVEDNLMIRAANALAVHSGVKVELVSGAARDGLSSNPSVACREPGTCVETILVLDKTIPIAGGMAGGSADAAATLLALREAWNVQISDAEMAVIGAALGADVPFCLLGGTALGTGTGTDVSPVPSAVFHWVVAVSDEGLSTPAVYGEFDRVDQPREGDPTLLLAALQRGDPDDLATHLRNDLQASAERLAGWLCDRRAVLERAGAIAVLLSGSGPTLLGLCRDENHAKHVAEQAAEAFDRVLVVRAPA